LDQAGRNRLEFRKYLKPAPKSAESGIYGIRKTDEFKIFMEEIMRLTRKLALTQNSISLGCHIGKIYLTYLNQTQKSILTRLKQIELAHSCLFLASKVRERDINCPMISHMINAGDFIIGNFALKKSELEVCAFFKYNLMLFPPYDYVEYMLHLSPLFYSDCIEFSSRNRNSESNFVYLKDLDPNQVKLISIKLKSKTLELCDMARCRLTSNFSHISSAVLAFLIVIEGRRKCDLNNSR
jgi:hypothetical protein